MRELLEALPIIAFWVAVAVICQAFFNCYVECNKTDREYLLKKATIQQAKEPQ